MLGLLPLVLYIPNNVKKIFIHHELGFIKNDLFIKQMNGNKYQWAQKHLGDIMEIGLLNRYDSIVTLSQTDKNKLTKAGVQVPIYSSFAVINSINTFSIESTKYTELTFLGPENHTPNSIGLLWFLENCWHELLNINNEYKLKIIGIWKDESIRNLNKKYKNLRFVGFVQNLEEALKNTIMIVPITIGSGIRIKILEAATYGVPIVSTHVGAEGLPLSDGINCFLSDTPNEFIQSIIKLKDKDLRFSFIYKANEVIKNNYSLKELTKNRIEIYEETISL